MAWRLLFQQFLEQRAVVDHRLAEVLGTDSRVLGGNSMRGSVVIDHLRMLYGDISGALLEILDRVAAFAHHRADQPVSGSGGLGGLVDELCLGPAPGSPVAVTRRQVE